MRRAVRPERTSCRPVRPEAFVVSDGVLNDQGLHALRMRSAMRKPTGPP